MMALVAAFVAHTSPAAAWGDLGHATICEMALPALTPAARAEVDRLVGGDRQHATFAAACSYADHPKQRPPGHYVNLPRDRAAVTDRRCPQSDDCLFRAYADDLAILEDTQSTDADRRLSLYLLAHWVGDFHQPFHVSFEDDRGGNAIRELCEGCDGNLHTVWDSDIIREAIGRDYRTNAARLGAAITDTQRTRWQADSPVVWADESFRIVRQAAVGYCVQQDGACWYAGNNYRLDRGEPYRAVVVDRAYLEEHAATVEQRLQQAAVRLAVVLNRVFD